MTHRPIVDEGDGVRRYAGGQRYRLKAPEERVYAVRKPADPAAVRFHGDWFLPLQTLPDAARAMPETRPDEQTLEHRASCLCEVCQRPAARAMWRRARRRLRSPAPQLTGVVTDQKDRSPRDRGLSPP